MVGSHQRPSGSPSIVSETGPRAPPPPPSGLAPTPSTHLPATQEALAGQLALVRQGVGVVVEPLEHAAATKSNESGCKRRMWGLLVRGAVDGGVSSARKRLEFED